MSKKAPDAALAIVKVMNGDVSLETVSMLVGKSAFLEPTDVARLYLASVSPHLETLRTLADEWIDSGIKADGSEQPTSRHLSEERRLEFKEIKGKRTLVSEPKSLIRRAVNDYQERYRVRLELNSRGGSEYVYTEIAAGDEMPEAQAVLLFIKLYRSPWLNCLMRCAKCRTYHLVNSPRASYVSGWYCKECRNSAPAARATKKARAHLTQRRLRYCAEQWLKDHTRRNLDKRVLAARVNERLNSYQRIKQNFVTWHWPEIIAQAAELRRYSESKGGMRPGTARNRSKSGKQ